MSTTNPDTQKLDTGKNSALAKTQRYLYYGLAIDSFARPIKRTKSLVSGVAGSALGFLKVAVQTKQYVRAKTIEEVIEVHDDCASTMVGTLIVIVFFAVLTFMNTENTYALLVNGIITAAFVFYFIANLFVYLKCQQVISQNSNLKSSEGKDANEK